MIPAISPNARIAGRRLRSAAYDYRANKYLAEALVPPGSDLTIGGDPMARLVVPSWVGPTLVLLSKDHVLHFEPGMRIHICHDNGEDRLVGEFDELLAKGVRPPITITVSKLNIRVRQGLSVFAKYLADEEPDWEEHFVDSFRIEGG